jgi:hypothetical protein
MPRPEVGQRLLGPWSVLGVPFSGRNDLASQWRGSREPLGQDLSRFVVS